MVAATSTSVGCGLLNMMLKDSLSTMFFKRISQRIEEEQFLGETLHDTVDWFELLSSSPFGETIIFLPSDINCIDTAIKTRCGILFSNIIDLGRSQKMNGKKNRYSRKNIDKDMRLDKMLFGGLQLSLILSREDVASSEKEITIVLKGDRGSDKTLFAMQMMHGIAKSLNNMKLNRKHQRSIHWIRKQIKLTICFWISLFPNALTK